MKFASIFVYLLLIHYLVYSQDSISKNSIVTTRLYLDAYYSYDFSGPISNEKAPFLYNYKKHNGIHANLALASISVKQKITRANFGLMAGTYSTYNLANEPGLLRHLFEANAE